MEKTHIIQKTIITFINTNSITTNTLQILVVKKKLHYSYIQTEFNDKLKMIINIFSSYVVPLLKYINHPTMLQ